MEISYVFSENIAVGGTPKLRVQPVQSTNFVSQETLQYVRVENDNTVVFTGTISGSKSRKSYRLAADAIRFDNGYIARSVTEAIADLSHQAMTGSTALVPPCGSTIPGHVWCARMTVGSRQNEIGFKSGSYGSIDNPATTYGTVDRLLYDQNLDFRFSRNGFALNSDQRPPQLQLTLGDRRYDVSTAVKLDEYGNTMDWTDWTPGGTRWVGHPYDPHFTHGDRVTVRMVRVPLIVRLAQESRDFTVNEGDQFAINFGLDNPAVRDLDVKVNLYSKRTYPVSNELGVHTVTISAGQSHASIQIQTTADEVLYPDQEIILTIVPTDRYSVDGAGKAIILNGSYVDELDTTDMPTGRTVFDIDADNVIAGWQTCNDRATIARINIIDEEVMLITVAEDVGKVDVPFAVKKGLVGYDFIWVMVNSEDTASRHNDYVDADAAGSLLMKAFETSTQRSVRIVDNKQLEDTERFAIWLFQNDLTYQIAIECEYLVIQITDDDTANLKVGEEDHTVAEGDTISFDVVVENETGDCNIPFPIAELTAEPSAGTALLETADQAPKSVRFSSCDASQTFEFETIVTPGTQADQTITFDVEMGSNTDSRITLEGQSSTYSYTVTVQDNGS